MKEKADQHSHEVQAQLPGHHAEVVHFQDLASDQEEHTDGGHVDDPRGDGHHGLR